MKKILGISAFFHDSSACLIVDNQIVAAALEERFTRVKHDASFPLNAIRFCLKEAEITSKDLDEIVYFEKPFTKFERILDNYSKQVPKGFWPFQKAIRSWLQDKFWIEDKFKKHFPFTGKFTYAQHHFCHAANACYQSEFDSAAYLILDGVGEKSCISYGRYENGQLVPIAEQHFPHSIGLLYSAFTQYCGFKVNSGEYKLMGLAPYGTPKYVSLIYDHFVSITEEGVIELSHKNFGFLNDLKMINKKFEAVFGKPARKPESEMDQFYKDVAASIQKVTEELIIKIAKYVLSSTGQINLVLGGGVALNCVANAQLNAQLGLGKIYIHSASGDGGCAMGAALWRAEQPINNPNQEYLGPAYTEAEIIQAIKQYDEINYQILEEVELIDFVAHALQKNEVVGWFQGRMEFGPRALGNRSILANPTGRDMKTTLNLKIKMREGFRPFAPVILAEHFSGYFEDHGVDYTKMLFVTEGKNKAKEIPACLHEDNTARVQKLEKTANPKLYQLIEKFYALTGVPVLINTSFNQRGEPMVCTSEDAINCFFNTEMDVLVMGNILIHKKDNLNFQINGLRYDLD